MRYEAHGYRVGRTVNNETQIFNSSWGCWGALANGNLRRDCAVNQIIWHTEINQFANTGLKKYAEHNNLGLETAIRNSVDAINEGYLDYEIEMIGEGPSLSCKLHFNNLNNKRRQRTMWILFTLRCWFQYSFQGRNAVWYMTQSRTKLTLREVIMYSQVINISQSPMRNNNEPRFSYQNDGGNCAYWHQMTLTEWRRLLKGGNYREKGQHSEDLWSVGGGYYSGQQVQRTANSWTKDYDDNFNNLAANPSSLNRISRQKTALSVHGIFREYWERDGAITTTEESMNKFIRFVKYRSKS